MFNFFSQANYGNQGFQKHYRVRSVAFHKPDAECGGKIFMCASALHELTMLNIQYPMVFELENPETGMHTHAGVLEFTAEEGVVYIPYWMMQQLLLKENSMIKIRNVNLPKATYIKIQPHATAFIEIANPKAVLEVNLRKFACLSKGDTFVIEYNGQRYYIDVVEVQPNTFDAVATHETDLELDFAAPLDYVEPPKPAAARKASETKEAQPVTKDAGNTGKDAGNSGFQAFAGSGFRLNGKSGKKKPDASPHLKSTPEAPLKSVIKEGVIVRVPDSETAHLTASQKLAQSEESSSDDGLDARNDVDDAESSDSDVRGFKPFQGTGFALKNKRRK